MSAPAEARDPRRYGLQVTGISVALLLVLSWMGIARRPLLRIDHAPVVVTRRSGALSAHVTGATHPFVHRVEYRLNQGDWRIAEPGRLCLTLEPRELLNGSNRRERLASAPLRGGERREIVFDYDSSPVRLPLTLADDHDLEVIAGSWERLPGASGPRVRPRGSGAGQHRLLVCGSFAGGRRVRASATLEAMPLAADWQFGVLAMFGGPVSPADRAEASVAYRAEWQGTEAAFHLDRAGGPPLWTHTSRSFMPQAGVRYEIVAECTRQPARDGEVGRHVLRCKWWALGQPEPADWIEVGDDEGAPLPEGEYGVALVASGCRVEFRDVSVEALR